MNGQALLIIKQNIMNFESYLALTDAIVNGEITTAPYDKAEMLDYTKMNAARMSRWLKTFEPSPEIREAIGAISEFQQWIVITEPWCGDAAHIVPILHKLAAVNHNIVMEISLRDSEPYLIDQYLTNGGKSIPKLVIRDDAGKDIAVWGPRPAGAQQLYNDLKSNNASFDDMKIALQKWYNEDRAESICREIVALTGSQR